MQYKYTHKTLKAMKKKRLLQWKDNNEKVKKYHEAKKLKGGFTFGELVQKTLNS